MAPTIAQMGSSLAEGSEIITKDQPDGEKKEGEKNKQNNKITSSKGIHGWKMILSTDFLLITLRLNLTLICG